MLAVLSVVFSTILVIVAWSIMGGFLTMLLDVGRRVEGDVTISWPTAGFAYYDDLIERLHEDDLVAGAAPMIETFGIVTLPDDRAVGLKIKGVDERFVNVSDFADQLWWKPVQTPELRDKERKDPRLPRQAGDAPETLRIHPDLLNDLYSAGLKMTMPSTDGAQKPGVVPGIEVMGFSVRQGGGYYRPAYSVSKRTTTGGYQDVPGFAPFHNLTIRVIPMDRKGRDMSLFTSRTLPIVNEYRTGLFEADKNTLLMSLTELQQMLGMQRQERLSDPVENPYAIEGEGANEQVPERRVIGVEPARVTTVLVKARPGIDAETLRARVIKIYAAFAAAHPDEVPSTQIAEDRMISTWERALATFIGAVRKETFIVVGMLVLMSFVCGILILVIFWAMVSEKTKDVGILRAVGGGRAGVAWLWLCYGMFIGIVGASIGLLLGSLLVWNINPIHEWLGEQFGLSVWDPNVYYFPTIPHHVDPWKALAVWLTTVVCAVLGALIPALRAAYMDPVKALRFE